ncbi:hypothetical protein RRG08_026797 [Elysia crispata]|uniref:Uncharacterized protein n=1 Tax=Elysia crispata TaxID=231223 RepID=A0AAE1E389_9GAST|nr:hypothetical protein RRG08_026797 [Elysia crispata]
MDVFRHRPPMSTPVSQSMPHSVPHRYMLRKPEHGVVSHLFPLSHEPALLGAPLVSSAVTSLPVFGASGGFPLPRIVRRFATADWDLVSPLRFSPDRFVLHLATHDSYL